MSSSTHPCDGEISIHCEEPDAGPAASVLGYATAAFGLGERHRHELHEQLERISSECERRELSLLEIVREQEPAGQHALERPGLEYALGRIAAGEASGLVVSDLSRLTHSLRELGRVLDWFSRRHVRLVAVGAGLDTDEPAGRLAVQAIIEVSHWERRRLIERTRSGIRAARRKGPARVSDYPELTQRIALMRAEGMTLQAIADKLNGEAVPTIRGGAKWRPSSVQAAAGYRRPPTNRMLDWQTQSERRRLEASC